MKTRRLSSIGFTALLCLAPLAFAQSTERGADLRALNGIVLNHHSVVSRAGVADAAGLKTQAARDFLNRQNALATWIEKDPDTALNLAFSADLLDSLRASFPENSSHLETQGSWSGDLQAAVEDSADLRGGTVIHRLITGGRTLRVFMGSGVNVPPSGRVTIDGVEAGGKVAARAIHAMAVTGGSGAVPASPQNILTVLVNLPSYKLPATATADFMKGVLYGNAYSSSQSTPNWSVDDFWQQNSDGLASAPAAAGLVVGPYTLASNYNTDSTGAAYCNYLAMQQDVINAVQSTVNFANFSRVVMVMPNNGACSWAGVSSIGEWLASSSSGSFNASFHWLRADTMPSRATGVQLLTHELGHGFGMNHARTRGYPGTTNQTLGAINTLGTLVEYGDPFSTMASWNFGFYDAMHSKEVLGWLGSSNYIQVQTSGTYTINAYETRNASSLVKALRVLRDAASNSWLWIEYRSNTGNYDSQSPSEASSGALIHYEDANTGTYTDLLDFTPSTASVFTDGALPAGQTWTDPYTNLSITAGAITTTTTGSALPLTINYGVSACTKASPTVSLSPLNPTVGVGASASFTVTVKSNNSSACPSAAYSIVATQASGLTGKLSATSLTLAGGATGTLTLTETAGSTTGTFAVSVKATDTGATNDVGIASTNVTVATTCTLASPTVSIAPLSVVLAPGASASLTISLKNNNSGGCAAASFNLSAIQPAGFSGTLSATSLTKVNSGATATATLTEKLGTTTGTYTIAVTGTNAANSAMTGFGATTVTVAACTLAAPALSISPSSTSINSGSVVNLTIGVTNTDSPSCPAATFSLTTVQPSGFTGKLTASSLTVASGTTATTTLSENTTKTAGTYIVTVTATNGSYKSSASATINVGTATTAKTGRISSARQ